MAFVMAYDVDAIFLGIKTIDDEHNHGVESGWRGDALQVAFTDETRCEGCAMFLYDYALHDDGHVIMHNERSPCVQHSAEVDCPQAAIGRFADVFETRYELKFPAASIGHDSFHPGDQFGFALMVTDVDSDGRVTDGGGWAGWAPYGE